MQGSRRRFLARLAGAGATAVLRRSLPAYPRKRAPGLQLSSIADALSKDVDGTLKKVAEAGFKEVELAQTLGLSANELATLFKDTGLACHSAHMFDLTQEPVRFMDFAKELGAKYMVTSFNPPPMALAVLRDEKPDFAAFNQMMEARTLDDYKRCAHACNILGEQANDRELLYAYHNHNLEFKKFGQTTGFDTLLEFTDPKFVHFELDCGWVAAAGYNPIDFLQQYGKRIKLLHITAFKPAPATLSLSDAKKPQPTELGKGVPDYAAIFAAVKHGSIEQYYLEQEPPFRDMTSLEAMKFDRDYLLNI